MGNTSNVRFKGFTEDWEQRKVSEMFKVTRGYVLPATDTSQEMTDEMPYPVYSSQTKDNGLMGYYSDYLYEDAITWTTDGANAGTVNFRDGKFYCTNVCGVLLSDKIETSKVIAEALNNVAKRYVSYVGNPKLMNNVMADIQIAVPISKRERDQISSYFSYLDQLITLHQQKCAEIKELKKYMLQNMFPQKDEKVPKIRFAGFTGDWEQRKLSEISDFITKGATPTTYGYDWQESGIPFFRNDAIKDNKFSYGDFSYISEEANEALQRSEIHGDDILVAITGDIGKAGIVPKSIEKGNINQHTARVRIIKDAIPYFVYQSLITDKQQKKYQLIKTGLSMPQLSLQQIRDTIILCPSVEEQSMIGECFINLDNLITLHQQKCNALKEFKKYMLQNMFPQKGENKCQN